MSGKFIVLNKKNILSWGLIIALLIIITCISGMSIINGMIETAAQRRLLPIYSVDTSDQKVALTFDCAWGADDIPSIVEVLNKNKVNATFFVVGDWVKKYPNAVKLLQDKGMEVRKSYF